MKKRKAFLVASLVLLLLGISAWGCGEEVKTPTPTPDQTQALREYVRKTSTIVLRFTGRIEELQSTMAELDREEMTAQEFLSFTAERFDELGEPLHDLQVDWSLIDPPPAAQDFHSRMAHCFDEVASATRRTHDAAAGEDIEATLNALFDLLDVLDVTCTPAGEEWDRLFEQWYGE